MRSRLVRAVAVVAALYGTGQPKPLLVEEQVLTDSTFWQAAGNTVSPLLMSVPARSRCFQARSVWTAMYFLPFEVSLVAAALIWQWMYDPLYGLALMASLSPASARKA